MSWMIVIISITTCYFQIFIPAALQKYRPSLPGAVQTKGRKTPLPAELTRQPAQRSTSACHAWVCKGQGAGEVPRCEAGAEPACQHQPCPCPLLPLPKGFLVYFKCLTWVQESGTWGKVPGLCPEGSIQWAGINIVGCFPPVIVD